MRRLIHAAIVAYLHRCHGAFHHGPYGHGVYVRLLSEDGFATCQRQFWRDSAERWREMLPSVGSKWRNYRSGKIGVVVVVSNAPEWPAVKLRFDDPCRRFGCA
jgi:hypothetical protein